MRICKSKASHLIKLFQTTSFMRASWFVNNGDFYRVYPNRCPFSKFVCLYVGCWYIFQDHKGVKTDRIVKEEKMIENFPLLVVVALVWLKMLTKVEAILGLQWNSWSKRAQSSCWALKVIWWFLLINLWHVRYLKLFSISFKKCWITPGLKQTFSLFCFLHNREFLPWNLPWLIA